MAVRAIPRCRAKVAYAKPLPTTIPKHVAKLEQVARTHDGHLPPVKWLTENGYFASYNCMMCHPASFRHINTAKDHEAEKYRPIMKPASHHTLDQYNIPGARFNPTTLELEPGLDEQSWMNIGRAISTFSESLRFWTGDLLQYGFRLWGKTTTFNLAAQCTGYSREVLYSCARIAKRFPPERRVAALTFHHHVAVERLEPEKSNQLLATAVDLGLSARQLREEAQRDAGSKPAPKWHRVTVHVSMMQDTHQRLKQRAGGHALPWVLNEIIEAYLDGRPVPFFGGKE